MMKWKLAYPDDEMEKREQERLKSERMQERADVMRDREKDDDELRWAEIENAMLHGGQ